MPIQIYRRQNQDDELAQAIMAGTQGFVQGRQMKQQNEEKSIANALMAAKIQELQRKTQALSEPTPEGYFRDTYSGKLHKTLPSVGGPGNMNPNLTATKFDAYGRPKEYQDYSTKPISGEAAGKLAGAQQGLKNTQEIIDEFGFQETPEGGIEAPGFLGNKARLSLAQFRPKVGIGLPGAFSTVAGGISQMMAGDKGKKLDLAFETLAENNLRARTGAAATEPEIQREKQRLITRMTDSEKIALDRLMTSEDFLRSAANYIRPGSAREVSFPTSGSVRPNLGSNDPLEAEAQAAIASGADPNAVRQRMEQLRGGR